ncbi:hypothetical protein Pcinc_008761 [Petrolisthes cinctipes]|uniref:Secreted protein n=1 Tax=Petrolisthes cinctipes TaxID=88211 RepID=A0AAE1GCJ8_PETCI|nr:hypothetical protein Pcinc_008761 [Petrolisthes cinctipes]
MTVLMAMVVMMMVMIGLVEAAAIYLQYSSPPSVQPCRLLKPLTRPGFSPCHNTVLCTYHHNYTQPPPENTAGEAEDVARVNSGGGVGRKNLEKEVVEEMKEEEEEEEEEEMRMLRNNVGCEEVG